MGRDKILIVTNLRLQLVTKGMFQVPFSKHVVICLAGFLGTNPGLQITEHLSLNLLRSLSPQRARFNSPWSGFLSGGQ